MSDEIQRTLHEPRIGTNVEGERICAVCGRNTDDPQFADFHGPIDLRARLDDAITAARAELMQDIARRYGNSRLSDFDRYTTLVELRARWEVLDRRGCERRSKTGTCIDKGFEAPCFVCRWEAEIEADVRRLLDEDARAALADSPKEENDGG